MFDTLATFNAVSRPKQSPSLINWLCFNSRQSAHYDIGFYGEKVAQALFSDAGFIARKGESYHGTDLHVVDKNTGEVFTVEVKTARQSEGRKDWQFCLNKPKNCSTSHSAYILLICIAQNGIFTYLIPSDFLGATKSFSITSHPEKYRGKVAAFRNRGSLSFQAASNVMALKRLQ
jgi:hypothetical protein